MNAGWVMTLLLKEFAAQKSVVFLADGVAQSFIVYTGRSMFMQSSKEMMT